MGHHDGDEETRRHAKGGAHGSAGRLPRSSPVGRGNAFQGNVKPLRDQSVSGRIRLAVWVLAGAVAMVMLIVCANFSKLLPARTAARQAEIAI